MRENQLNELQGTSILTKSFFNKLIRRIECTKPLAGFGINIKQQENGIEISTADTSGYNAITLNVCSNGTPIEILVLAKFPDDYN
jgi:hypothetical protein